MKDKYNHGWMENYGTHLMNALVSTSADNWPGLATLAAKSVTDSCFAQTSGCVMNIG